MSSAALARIREEAAAFPIGPFLLSVGSDGRPHCKPTTATWADDAIVVDAPSKWAASEESGHRHVSLLWPPALSGGYSLIVDGVAHAVDADAVDVAAVAAGGQLSITPTRAVLHRSGDAPGDSQSACGSDCVPIFSAGGNDGPGTAS